MSIGTDIASSTIPNSFASAVRSSSSGSRSQHIITFSTSMDYGYGDVDSDEGDQLNTPVSDSAQLIAVAYPSGSGDGFETANVATDIHDECATATTTRDSPSSQGYFSTPQKSADSAPFKNHISESPTSVLSSPSFASPSLDSSMLCSTTLLNTRISLEDDFSLDMYPSSMEDSFAPLSPLHKQPSMAHSPVRPSPIITQSTSPIHSSPPLKRTSDSLSPLSGARAGQKPKLSRAFISEFLPSTLGLSYNERFPPSHRIRSDFVRTYALDGELGAGGYGFVMAARSRVDGEEVAVKFVLKKKVPKYGWATDDNGRIVPKEAFILSRLEHPSIVRFINLYEDSLYFYLVMELHGTPWPKKLDRFKHVRQTSLESVKKPTADENVPPQKIDSDFKEASGSKPSKLPKLVKGPLNRPVFERRSSHDLFECIEQSKHKRFSDEDAKYIFAQLIDVVGYLNDLGVTHCDIKDENVVIDKNLKIKLIDFGSAVSSDPTQERPYYDKFYGTSAYASPEIIWSQPYKAPPAEIWAIGVLLSCIVTGSSPFKTPEDSKVGRIRLSNAVINRMSPECLHLMKRCLDVNPARRADIAEVKAHPWLAAGFERLGAEQC